jgi:glutaredoxin
MNIKLLANHYFIAKKAIIFIALLTVFMITAGHLYAQQVYKSVDKNGRVTYSEVPPLLGSGEKLTGDAASGASLPYALQQVVNRYPVTLYTTADCNPCVSAKLMLTQRGVPFTERSVSSNEDIAAFKKLSGDTSMPLATIATHQLKGYEESEWTKYLDAAGYPKSSVLPRNYRNAEAISLAPKKPIEKPEKTEDSKPATTKPKSASIVNSNNPAGIKF